MGIFEKFDQQVNMDQINKQKQEASDSTYEEVPAGTYIAKIENMELGLTKSDHRPMFKVMMRLVEGCGDVEEAFLAKYKKPCVFMNRVIFGTKNDGSMIKSVETFLNKLGLNKTFVFAGYSDFANEIMDAAEECESLEFEINYDPNEFNSISVTEVYEA